MGALVQDRRINLVANTTRTVHRRRHEDGRVFPGAPPPPATRRSASQYILRHRPACADYGSRYRLRALVQRARHDGGAADLAGQRNTCGLKVTPERSSTRGLGRGSRCRPAVRWRRRILPCAWARVPVSTSSAISEGADVAIAHAPGDHPRGQGAILAVPRESRHSRPMSPRRCAAHVLDLHDGTGRSTVHQVDNSSRSARSAASCSARAGRHAERLGDRLEHAVGFFDHRCFVHALPICCIRDSRAAGAPTARRDGIRVIRFDAGQTDMAQIGEFCGIWVRSSWRISAFGGTRNGSVPREAGPWRAPAHRYRRASSAMAAGHDLDTRAVPSCSNSSYNARTAWGCTCARPGCAMTAQPPAPRIQPTASARNGPLHRHMARAMVPRNLLNTVWHIPIGCSASTRKRAKCVRLISSGRQSVCVARERQRALVGARHAQPRQPLADLHRARVGGRAIAQALHQRLVGRSTRKPTMCTVIPPRSPKSRRRRRNACPMRRPGLRLASATPPISS